MSLEDKLEKLRGAARKLDAQASNGVMFSPTPTDLLPETPILSVPDIVRGQLTKYSPTAISNFIKRGELHAYRVGRSYFLDPEAVLELQRLEEGSMKRRPHPGGRRPGQKSISYK